MGSWHEFSTSKYRPNSYHRLGWWGYVYSRMEEVRSAEDIDLLILGSSHAYRGFDTRKFEALGIETINMGTGAQSPVLTKMLVKRHIDKLNPKLVLFEVSPIIFSSDPLESSLDLLANDSNDQHSIEMVIEVNQLKAYNSLVVAVFKSILSINSDFIENETRGKDKYIKGGYVERKMETFQYLRMAKKDHELHEKQLLAFESILEILKEREIETYLIQAPITRAKYRSHKINSHFDSLMNSYGNYIDFNRKMILDDSLHFYDAHHLNQAGVDSFNNELIRLLEMKKMNFD